MLPPWLCKAMLAASSLSERTNEVGQERGYQARFVHFRGAERLWRLPRHRKWVSKRHFYHLSDRLIAARHPAVGRRLSPIALPARWETQKPIRCGSGNGGYLEQWH